MRKQSAPPANDRTNAEPPSNYAPSSYAPSVAELTPPPPANDINYADPPSDYAPSSYAPTVVDFKSPPPPLPPIQRPPPRSRSSGTGFASLISYLRGVPEDPEDPEAPVAPESTYAESVYCESIYSEPAPSSAASLKYSRNKPIAPDPLKGKYYQAPPASNREPPKLYNRDCGAKYKTVAAIKKFDAALFANLMACEQMKMMQVIATVYHYRMNSIPGKNMLSAGAIRGIFDCDITDYQFSLNELYKRLAMRDGTFRGVPVANYNFWSLPAEEMDRFREWLQRIGSWADGTGLKYTLWTLGKDDDGKLFLKLRLNAVTVNWLQLLNGIADSLAQWKSIYRGKEYIEQLDLKLPFKFC